MHAAFEVHKLNQDGLDKAGKIAAAYNGLLDSLALPDGREKSIVITKLEEACFFSKKAIANDPKNQEGYVASDKPRS